MKSLILRAPEVRALLDERRVTVRRPVRWPILSESDGAKRRLYVYDSAATVNDLLASHERHPLRRIRTPFGRVGERCWIRETWAPNEGTDGGIIYRADHHNAAGTYTANLRTGEWTTVVNRWRSSLTMSRDKSRLTTETRSIRVEHGDEWVAELVRVDSEGDQGGGWLNSEEAAREETEFERACERHRHAEDALGWSPRDEYHD